MRNRLDRLDRLVYLWTKKCPSPIGEFAGSVDFHHHAHTRVYKDLPLILISSKKDIKKLFFKFIVSALFSILVVLLLYYFRGTFEHTLKICESLGSYAPVRCTEWGPTYALQHDLLKDQTNQDMSFFYFQADIKSWLGYTIYVFYAFFTIFLQSSSLKILTLSMKSFNFESLVIIIY